VLTSYDRSSHISHTLRRMAECEEQLKMTDAAARHRQQLSALFPQSPAMSLENFTSSKPGETKSASAPEGAPAPAPVATGLSTAPVDQKMDPVPAETPSLAPAPARAQPAHAKPAATSPRSAAPGPNAPNPALDAARKSAADALGNGGYPAIDPTRPEPAPAVTATMTPGPGSPLGPGASLDGPPPLTAPLEPKPSDFVSAEASQPSQ
jgi:hypothetical protein